MNASGIETITNNLADGYNQLVPGTFQEAYEVQNRRRTDSDLRARLDLRKRWVYTANLPLYRIREGSLEYGLSGRQAFDDIAGKNINKFTRQILQKGAYRLTKPQVRKLENLAADIVWAKAADLNLVCNSEEWSYFLIDTSDITAGSLNDAQKPFAAKAYGSMETKYTPEQKLSDYGENMSMLKREGKINKTRLFLPTPAYIEGYLGDGVVVALASGLGDFGLDSW